MTQTTHRALWATKVYHAKTQREQRRKEEAIYGGVKTHPKYVLDFASLLPLRLCVSFLPGKQDLLFATQISFLISKLNLRNLRMLFPLPQVFVKPVERSGPRKFGGGLVVARRRVVMEAVLLAFVHV